MKPTEEAGIWFNNDIDEIIFNGGLVTNRWLKKNGRSLNDELEKRKMCPRCGFNNICFCWDDLDSKLSVSGISAYCEKCGWWIELTEFPNNLMISQTNCPLRK